MGRTVNNRSGVSNLCGCYIPLLIYSNLSGVSTGERIIINNVVDLCRSNDATRDIYVAGVS